MDRDEDIKKTLSYNLESIKNSKFSSIRLIDFNNDYSQLIEWAKQNFKQSIVDKKLFLHQEPRLKYWHFSIAKNKFKNYIKENYYSSLDGDNYISNNEILDTENIINSHNEVFIHHFSGVWGDGTCGRITLPTYIYKNIGYTENIFPRQFDETGLIVNTIVQNKDITFYCVNKNIFLLSQHLNEFITTNKISINTKKYITKIQKFPINKKTNDYILNDIILYIYSNINRIICLYPLSNAKYKKILNCQFEAILKKIEKNNLYHKLYDYIFDKSQIPNTIKSIRFANPYIIINNNLNILPKVGFFDIPNCKKLWLNTLQNYEV